MQISYSREAFREWFATLETDVGLYDVTGRQVLEQDVASGLHLV